MEIDQHRYPEPGACGGQCGGQRGVIGAMVVGDPRGDLGVREAPPPQVARRRRPSRHQSEAASKLGGGHLADRPRALVHARIAFFLAAVEIDPGARAPLYQHRLAATRGMGDGIDVAILQHRERRCRHP